MLAWLSLSMAYEGMLEYEKSCKRVENLHIEVIIFSTSAWDGSLHSKWHFQQFYFYATLRIKDSSLISLNNPGNEFIIVMQNGVADLLKLPK